MTTVKWFSHQINALFLNFRIFEGWPFIFWSNQTIYTLAGQHDPKHDFELKSNKSCPPYRPFRYLISHDFDDFSDWMCFKNELKNLIKLNQKDVPAFVCQNQMCFSHISKLKLQSWCSFHTNPQRKLDYLKLRTGCFIIF